MDNYIVSARKYRPASFNTVVGQESLTITLKNAISSGRLAHAYLFCGPRGVGKTTCARIFAKTINCLSLTSSGEACNECESCKAFNEQRSYNIHELDAASNNSVEDIRQLIDQVRIPPQIGKYKVFIIDEVHMLSQQAFNAFLKTLEEPPHHAIFILATTEKHKLLPTILSRCQIYDFSRMSADNIVRHLQNVADKEGITVESSALNVIAQKADGGMRDALSIFDQVASFCNGNITYQQTITNLNVLDSDYYFRLTDFFLEGKITECMLTFNEILSKGFEGQYFISGLSSHFRNLLVAQDAQTVSLIEASEDVRKRYAEQAQKCTPQFLYRAMRLCNDCDLNYKQSQNKRLLVELTLIETAQLVSDDTPSSGRSPKKILKPIFNHLRVEINKANHSQRHDQDKVVNNGNRDASLSDTPNNFQTYQVQSDVNRTGSMQSLSTKIAVPVVNTQSRTYKSFSISDRLGKNKQVHPSATSISAPNTDIADSVPDMNKSFEEIELVRSWREFAHSLTDEETGITHHLDNLEPKLLEDGVTFEVVIDNQSLENQLSRYVSRIENYIRKSLQNSSIRMKMRLREVEDKPRLLNRVEQYKLMCQQNNALAKLASALELVLD